MNSDSTFDRKAFEQGKDYPELRRALSRLKAGSETNFYLSLILSEAEQTETGQTIRNETNDPFSPILASINNLIRSLQRSGLTSDKIRKKISALPDPAKISLAGPFSRRLNRTVDLHNADWSQSDERKALVQALKDTRILFRKRPGPKQDQQILSFAGYVAMIYEQIKGKPPGLGSDNYQNEYQSPFEKLWLTSLRLVEPDAEHYRAREIYRSASQKSLSEQSPS